MTEVEIRFEREKRDGAVAVGTYLIDAAGRLGIEVEAECGRQGQCDSCAVTITRGADILSEATKSEIEQLTAARRKKGERLACQAKLEKSGEVTVMTKAKQAEEKPKAEEKADEFRKEFEELPLEKKIASLLELEAIALSETFSFVINSPYKIFEKAMDVLAEMGLKLEDDTKKAKRPEEHKPQNGNAATAKAAPAAKKPGTATRKRAVAKKRTPKKES